MATFVLEIGSEEVPSRFLPTEEQELEARFTAALEENALEHGQIRALSTPRRAILVVEDLNPVQTEREEVVAGPPVRVAYDADGKPTKALEGFVRTNGCTLDDVFRQETPKGEYVAVRKRIGGAAAGDLLATICPAIITALPFAKRMRWGANHVAYARPLRWIVALLDSEVVPFEIGPVVSGRETCGHRIHGRGPFSVAHATDLLPLLADKGGITPLPADRRAAIISGGDAQAAAVGGKVLWKDSLLREVEGLTEHPVPLLGDFDASYLEVPREVLLTSMESHQKSFGVEGPDGALLPHFLTVLNLTPEDMGLVKRGWERVLRARLEDARFFWHADLRATFDSWLEKLDHVIFIGRLGSMGEKTRRLESLCRHLAETVADGKVSPDDAARAGRLSKADLVSGMVGEFDTLQGIMGGIYAERKGRQGRHARGLLRSRHDSHRRGRPQRSAPLRHRHSPHCAGIRPDSRPAQPLCPRAGALRRPSVEAGPERSRGQTAGLHGGTSAQLLAGPGRRHPARGRDPRRRFRRHPRRRTASGGPCCVQQGSRLCRSRADLQARGQYRAQAVRRRSARSMG